jgi:hypothetical protein
VSESHSAAGNRAASDVSGQPAGAELPGPVEAASPRRGGGHPALLYTLLRIGLFAVVLGAVWLVSRYALKLTGNGAGIVVVGVSLAVSGLLSYFLLNSQRDAMSAALVDRVERAKARIDEGASAEDDLISDITPATRPKNAM